MTAAQLSPSARKLLEDIGEDGLVWNGTGSLSGGVAIQVRKSLIKAGLLERRPWDNVGGKFEDSEGPFALRVTDAGKAALGAQKPATQPQDAAPAPTTATKAPTPRQNSKQAQLVDMLRRPAGASIAQICDAFGWQAHTARAAISTLPRKAGVAKTTSTMEGRERIYKLPATA